MMCYIRLASRLATHQVLVPNAVWNAMLVEQGKPALLYLRYTMREVRTYVRTLTIRARYVAIIGPAARGH
jgi:hypothetical protein